MTRTQILTTLLACTLLAACGDKAEEAAPVANQESSSETTQTAQVEAVVEQSKPAEATEALAAVEESDGSYSAEEAAREVSLRMAQDNTSAAPERFKEGKDYERLRPTRMTVTGTDVVEVAEVFWYGCGHCYNLEPVLQRWADTLDESVRFVQLPAVWNPMLETHAKGFFTIESLAAAGKLADAKVVHRAFFDEMHLNKKRMGTPSEIGQLLSRFGVNTADFTNTWNSFEIDNKLRQAKTLNRSYNIASVPTIIVNGKYVTSETHAGSKANLLAVIDELIASEK